MAGQQWKKQWNIATKLTSTILSCDMFECQRRMIFAGTFNQTFWMLNVKYRLLKPWFCIVYPFVPHEGSKLHGQSLIHCTFSLAF